MIDLSQYTPAIYVELEPGIYVFSASSTEGKTYLCSLLRKLRNRERVDSHTYPFDFHPAELFDSSKRDLVMLDRYDMYSGAGVEEMIRFAQNGIVLIGSELLSFPMPVMPCMIRMYQDKLVVR